MTTNIAARPASHSFQPPFAPSWVNRLTDWIAGLPGPSWVYYFAFWAILFAALTLVQWNQGGYPVGTFNSFHLVATGAVVVMLLLIQYMNHAAHDALTNAHPLLNLNDAEFDDLQFRFTNLPARATLAASLVPALFGLPALLRPEFFVAQGEIASTPLSIAALFVNSLLLSFTAGAVLYQMYRQTRFINTILRKDARVDLFHLSPLYGFARVTALPAFALILLSTAFYLAQPRLVDDPSNLVTLFFGIALSVAVFVLPLVGAHNRILAEKERVLGETTTRVQAAIATLHHSADAQDWNTAAQLKDTLTALDIEEKMLERIPTWPWQPEMPRLLFTALFIPLVLFIIQYIVQKIIAP